MPRIALDLNKADDLGKVKAQWRVAQGLVPGEPNEGLTAQIPNSPARAADYDDSGWEVCTNVRRSRSKGFTFAWYRIKVEIPEEVDGVKLAGSRVYFETNIDNYGEIWVDGKIDREGTVNGNNVQKRIEISRDAKPGDKHVIACLAANGPFGEPRGGVFMRYATLAFETAG
jgi:gluconolactonase